MTQLTTLIAASEQQRELWKYTSLRALRDMAFAPAAVTQLTPEQLPALLDSSGQRAVFINGVLQPELSALAALPAGCLTGDPAAGYQLQVPEQTCLATVPLEILCVATGAETPQQSLLRLAITLGANARVTLLERHISLGAGAPHAVLVDCSLHLAEQAKLVHLKFQEQAVTDYHLATTEATLAKGAYYDQFCCTIGAALSRHSITVVLAAPEAQTRLHGIYLLRGSQHGDTTSLVQHNAPHTTSQEHYRGVLDDKARGVFQGKIIVAPHAQKTAGQQMSRALLLSDQAEANHKPELEIYADDVQCSHGATVGQLDETALFYLRARGIPLAQARAMLIAAFITAVIEEASVPAGRNHATELANRWSS
jgi:Fe-S cluster assembly protein SufD